jgi:hypothetical protein
MNDATYFAVPSGSLLYMWFNCLTMDGESLRSASIGPSWQLPPTSPRAVALTVKHQDS